MTAARRYRTEATERWDGFVFRPGDIVISTRTKSGTTWMQMICALLVFQSPDLPDRLAELSPWIDWDIEPVAEVHARLAAQSHRRFIKTHTPLDGIPLDERATYIVVVRHPLDVAVSTWHHLDNLDPVRRQELATTPRPVPPPRPPLDEWARAWIGSAAAPEDELDALPGVLHHAADAWDRRNRPNVVLVHYQDLVDDLDGEMRRLAGRLGIAVDEAVWPALVGAARFEAMKRDASRLAPDRLGILRDRDAFFRSGRSGEGRELVGDLGVARFRARAAELVAPDLLAWIDR